MNKTVIIVFITSLMSLSFPCLADSGSCKGKSTQGVQIAIDYYRNTWVDDNVEYYADITFNYQGLATYALYGAPEAFTGNVTARSLKVDGLDFGKAEFRFTSNQTRMSGSLGSAEFKDLKCSYQTK